MFNMVIHGNCIFGQLQSSRDEDRSALLCAGELAMEGGKQRVVNEVFRIGDFCFSRTFYHGEWFQCLKRQEAKKRGNGQKTPFPEENTTVV